MATVTTQGYVDIYLLPVRAGSIEEYADQATTFGEVARDHGALSYREFLGDDLAEGFSAGEGEVLVAAVVEFESRQHRDEVMSEVMDDERVAAMIGAEQVADMSQMRYGGFATLVDA